MSWLWLWLPFAALLSGPPGEPGPANLPALTLRWDAPDPCPDEAQVRQRVAAYLSEGTALRELSAEAKLREREPGAWSLELRFDGGAKQLEGGSCGELADAAAVVLSLALAPGDEEVGEGGEVGEAGEAGETGEASDEPPPVDPPAPDPPIVEAPSPEPAPSAEPLEQQRRVGALLRADLGIGVGVTPTLTTGALTLGVAWPQARLELTGMLWSPSDARGLDEGERALVTLGTVGLRGCGELSIPRRALSVPLCAGVAAGALRLDERGPDSGPVQIAHLPWSGAFLGPALVWHLGRRVSLWFGAELWLGFGRAVSPAAATGYRTGLVGVRGAAGVEFDFLSRNRGRPGKR